MRESGNNSVLRLISSHVLGDRATLLMLHRFSHPDGDPNGISAEGLRASLQFLRKNRYNIISLDELVRAKQEKKPLSPFTACFTIDDGYADFVDVGLPVFREFDCPVTVFLPTGFIDGSLWLWWDKVHYAILTTRRDGIGAFSDNVTAAFDWTSRAGRISAIGRLNAKLKTLPDPIKSQAIVDLARHLDIELPICCPFQYRPMTWDEVRSCTRYGVTFGPHTVTHPILSRVADDVAEFEISHSWERVREETSGAIPVFCYPNGDPASFSEREYHIAAKVGLTAAVTSEPRYLTREDMVSDAPEGAYLLPRFSYPGSSWRFVPRMLGLDRMMGPARGAVTWWRKRHLSLVGIAILAGPPCDFMLSSLQAGWC